MKFRELDLGGPGVFSPTLHTDRRGYNYEPFQASAFLVATGEPFETLQVNVSVSTRDVIRGIHFAEYPPGQAKYVTVVAGAILDVVVDLRAGSATYGQWETVRLDDDGGDALYVPNGFGHGFRALTEHVTVVYLCAAEYAPQREHGINPFDPRLGIDWGVTQDAAVLSDKDAAAPNLDQLNEQGVVPLQVSPGVGC